MHDAGGAGERICLRTCPAVTPVDDHACASRVADPYRSSELMKLSIALLLRSGR